MTEEARMRQRMAGAHVPPGTVDVPGAAREGRRRLRRRRLLATGAAVGAALVLAAVPVAAHDRAGSPAAGGAGPTDARTGAAATLAAYRGAALSALERTDMIEHTWYKSTSPTGSQRSESWVYATPTSSLSRDQSFDGAGHLIHDLADRTVYRGGYRGEARFIEYIGKVNEYATWTLRLSPNPDKPRPNASPSGSPPDGAPARSARLKAALASHSLALVGPTTLDGRPAILLSYVEGAPSDRDVKHGRLWLDPTTYRSMQNIVTMGDTTTTITYEYLAPTAANLSHLWFTPQPGWRRVPADRLPRDLLR
jgi:hypothetical protein